MCSLTVCKYLLLVLNSSSLSSFGLLSRFEDLKDEEESVEIHGEAIACPQLFQHVGQLKTYQTFFFGRKQKSRKTESNVQSDAGWNCKEPRCRDGGAFRGKVWVLSALLCFQITVDKLTSWWVQSVCKCNVAILSISISRPARPWFKRLRVAHCWPLCAQPLLKPRLVLSPKVAEQNQTNGRTLMQSSCTWPVLSKCKKCNLISRWRNPDFWMHSQFWSRASIYPIPRLGKHSSALWRDMMLYVQTMCNIRLSWKNQQQ